MNKKTLLIIIGITGAVCTCVSTIIAQFSPSWEPIAVGIIGAVNTCVDTICAIFLKNGEMVKKLEKK